MKYVFRLLVSVTFLFSALSPSFLSAIDSRSSARILDNFKEQQKEILFETLPFSDTGSNILLEHEYKKNGLDGLKARLALLENAYSLKKELASQRRLDLETAVAAMDKAINDTETQIRDTESQISEKERQSQELARLSLEIKQKIHLHRTTILEYLANIYSDGNVFLDGKGNVDIVKTMILSDQDIDMVLQDTTYKSLVTILGQKFVDDYRALVKEYYLLGLRMEEEKVVLDGLKKSLERERTNIIFQKNERIKLLEITKGQEDLFRSYLEASEKAQASVESAWQQVDADYQKSITTLLQKNGCDGKKEINDTGKKEKCDRIREYFHQEEELRKTQFATGANILVWPVAGKRISSYFRDADYYRALGSQHEAIDIPVTQGTDVVAAAPGYVTYVLPPVSGGYAYLAIKHKDNFVTVYGHMSEISVAVGDFVDAGTRIGKSGGAVGTPGAGPMTSGPHLHLEVWQNREPQDPLRYLSLADLEYGELLPRYQDKFIADIIEKTGDQKEGSKYQRKFVIQGDDEKTRQKYLLSKYATNDFNNWDMWVTTALDAQIDPSFLMCVGLAETTLGNYLKTPYNIGNIGNTDDGSTYEFASPREGLEWMTKTFNNKYLSKYTHVSELSRWGNDKGAIYASSNANWHNNVIRCLSALKGRFVEDDYMFRLK